MAVESACIPLPSELIMPFGGYLCYQGTFKLFWPATAGAIDATLGSLVAYEIGSPRGGRSAGRTLWLLDPMGRRELDWSDRFFARWGYLAVFVGRLLPVVRTFIALPAGVARMPRRSLSTLHISGILALVLCPGVLRNEAGENWRDLGKYFHKFDAV